MSRFFRFLTRRRKSQKRDYTDSSVKSRARDSDIECVVTNLDNDEYKFYLDRGARGQMLEDFTFHQIEVADDKNYFGLQYSDEKNVKRWLDISKKVRKQCEVGPPYSFRFRVKFFSSDPCNQLSDDFSRYLFVLQLKQMIRDGDLIVDSLEHAAELSALALQGEFGDYDDYEHTLAFISEFKFIPNQTEEFELMVRDKYALLKDRNLVPSITDRQYLDKCRYLPDYGVDRHNIKGKNNSNYSLGLTPSGILIYEGPVKIGLFPWGQVTKLSFKKSRFKIVVHDNEPDEDGEMDHTFVFQSSDVSHCKQLWKSCVEHHAFYRLEGAHKAPTRFQQLFRLKSRFYASFHTEYQMAVRSQFGSTKSRRSAANASFSRAPSLRSAPRASFLRNEADRKQIQQKYRDKVREESKQAAASKLAKPKPPPPPMTQLKSDLVTKMRYDPQNPQLLALQQSITSDSTTMSEESDITEPAKKPPRNVKPSPRSDQKLITRPGNTGSGARIPANRNINNNNNDHKVISGSTTSRDSSSDNASESGSYSPLKIEKPPTPLKPGYAPIPPKRNIKPQPNKNQNNIDQVILV